MKRVMVIDRKKQTIEHKLFKDVIDYFDDGDVLILNNTKVFPARCMETKKKKTGLELKFFLRELNAEQRLWDVLLIQLVKFVSVINYTLVMMIH
jgi:S-adenosylmethionine:tRNA ribosyltransferase-isomerase